MRVLVSGYYGFANTGDEAIALAITRELKTAGHHVTLLSAHPAASAHEFGVRAAPRMQPAALLRAVMNCDVLLSGGGGLLQDSTSARNLTYYLGVIRLARMLGKRVVVFNQSIGPLSPNGGKRVSRALRGTTAIVRDRGSLKVLEGLGVPARLGGDPALLLSPTSVTRDENRVVIAPRGGQRIATERLARLADALRAHGRTVTALSFQPELDDAEAALLGGDIVSTADPQVALDAIASAGFVIGVRLHAVILAAAAGVPFAGISYDPKVAGFCADADAPSVGTQFNPRELLDVALERHAPDWNAVRQMRTRARDSFRWALEG